VEVMVEYPTDTQLLAGLSVENSSLSPLNSLVSQFSVTVTNT
jgi:hypothetical protein